MRRKKIRGVMTQGVRPEWGPLERLIEDLEVVGQFMWMFEVVLADGRSLQAYKHWATRRYLHLAEDGGAFAYVDGDLYEPVPVDEVLEEVLAPLGRLCGLERDAVERAYAVLDRIVDERCTSPPSAAAAASIAPSASGGHTPRMGLLERLFGPALDAGPSARRDADAGRAPDAEPEDVVLPKQKKSSRSLLAGKPPVGWGRHASEASGGAWPWSGGSSDGGGGSGGGSSDGGSSGGGGG